jgi:hypothetical protein
MVYHAGWAGGDVNLRVPNLVSEENIDFSEELCQVQGFQTITTIIDRPCRYL